MRTHLLRVAFGAIAIALLPAASASAHASLEISSPAPSATLESSPGEIVLDFSEPVNSVERSVELFDESLRSVAIPSATSTAADRIEVRDLPSLGNGLYLVTWRALSQDGHVAEGAFTFQIGTGSTSVSAEDLITGVDSSSSSPAGLWAVRIGARSATYLGLAGALGSLAFAVAARARRVRAVVGIGWCAATLGTALQFAVQVVEASGGSWSKVFDWGAWSDVVSTRLGLGLVVRLGLLCVLLVLLLAMRRGPDGVSSSRTSGGDVEDTTWWRSSSALVGAGIIMTFALTGHPSASSPAALAIAIDAVHLSAVVLWLGGLFVIVGPRREVAEVQSFSRMATFAIPIAVLTGVWQAWHLLDDGDDITGNEWGRALVVKVVFVLFTSVIALTARWVVRSADLASVRRLVAVEVACAVAIVASTSFLVTSPPRASAVPQVTSVSLAQDDIIANVTVTPGRVGFNEIHVTIVTPGGTLDPVDGLEIRMSEGDSSVPPVAVEVEPLGPNHFLGTVAVLRAGTWTIEFLVKVSESRIVRLTTTVDI